MKSSMSMSRGCAYCIGIGFSLMSFALFLNPMDPNDFLRLAYSDPLATIREAYGIRSAVSFWISVALMSTGLIGVLGSRNR